MNVQELFSIVRNTLQDKNKLYWDDSELLAYYNEAIRKLASERLENRTTATLTLVSGQNEYDTSGVLRYINAKDNLDNVRTLYPDDGSGDDDTKGIIIQRYNQIYVNDPDIGTTVTLKIIALPTEANLTSVVRTGDEIALQNYVLGRSYEKDSDMENFSKAGFFMGKFFNELKNLKEDKSSGYKTESVDTTKSYNY